MIDLKVTEGIAPQEEQIILERLLAYNHASFGESERRDLSVPLYDRDGELTGGLVGYTGRGWLHVAMLFVPEMQRSQGIGSRMMRLAEEEAVRRRCIGAYVDTMNPQALPFYRRLGYSEIGILDSLSGGHRVTWLEKRLS